MRLWLLALVFLSACATARIPQWSDAMSDGCTIPKHAIPFFAVTKADTACCVVHDRAYYFGGSERARYEADSDLATCWLHAGMGGAQVTLGYTAVRVGGGPYGRQPYSWAFGGNRFVYSDQPAREQ